MLGPPSTTSVQIYAVLHERRQPTLRAPSRLSHYRVSAEQQAAGPRTNDVDAKVGVSSERIRDGLRVVGFGSVTSLHQSPPRTAGTRTFAVNLPASRLGPAWRQKWASSQGSNRPTSLSPESPRGTVRAESWTLPQALLSFIGAHCLKLRLSSRGGRVSRKNIEVYVGHLHLLAGTVVVKTGE